MSAASPVTAIRSLVQRFRARFTEARDAGKPLYLCIYNDPSSGLTDAQVARAVRGCAIQLQRDVAPEYELQAPVLEFSAAGQGPSGATVNHVVAKLQCVGEITDDPEAQGYHTALGSGSPFDGYISTQGLDFDGFCECLSHELIETTCDPYTDNVFTAANGDAYPEEPCDFAQAQSNAQRVPIDIADGGAPIMCANWATRGKMTGRGDYFNPATPADMPTDFLGQIKGPFSLGEYGYSAITKADGTQTQVFGAGMSEQKLPPEKLHPESRVQIRIQKMAARDMAAHEEFARRVFEGAFADPDDRPTTPHAAAVQPPVPVADSSPEFVPAAEIEKDRQVSPAAAPPSAPAAPSRRDAAIRHGIPVPPPHAASEMPVVTPPEPADQQALQKKWEALKAEAVEARKTRGDAHPERWVDAFLFVHQPTTHATTEPGFAEWWTTMLERMVDAASK